MTEQLKVSAADLQKLIAEGVAAAMASTKKGKQAKGKAGGRKKTDEEKAAARVKTDAEVLKVFTKAGFKDVVPRETVRTYKKWLEAGRIVKKGEKNHKVGSFPLFHISQTEPIVAQPQPQQETASTVH